MLKENHDLAGALKKYMKLLGEGSYFEAHEVLEEAWHPLRKADHPVKNLVRGLINGAVSFEHLKRNRKNAANKARKVIASYERYKAMASNDVEHSELFRMACKMIEDLKAKHKEVF
ncbi:MAG: DUF309 domain-containing protein [Campylobacterales bacterium]|nr:DUF309 domain-containing protein [Campylobacterales bacterium]